MSGQRRIRAVVMRGGTSRAVFFRPEDLPTDPTLRDRVVLKVFGGGDPYGRQIDGLGGATSTTSKMAIIAPASVPGADVDYTFGQVNVSAPMIDYGGNCGNISSAVGPYAIDEGLVQAGEPVTTVRIWQTNTRKRIVAHVPTQGGRHQVEGDYAIDGVPASGAPITLEFLEPGGSMTGRLLPTGHAAEPLEVPGVGTITVSLVDAANPVVFVKPGDLGLAGTEMPDRIDADSDLLSRIEAIRAHAAVRMGLAATPEEATAKSPGVPKLAFASAPASYASTSGRAVDGNAMDVAGRIMSMGRLHRSYALTGAICTAVASLIDGTVVHAVVRSAQGAERTVRIGHPAGIIEAGAQVARRDGTWVAEKVVTRRTARRLMEGVAFVPASLWPAGEAAKARPSA
ncbi:MAG: 2-methylaconitate cis-trans isomerase PrpF family protein, partial [Armatimonadota bacterium]